MCNLDMYFVSKILEEIRHERNIDFSQYKKNTILRRLNQRMIVLNIYKIKEYYEYFLKNKEEINKLLELFFINTTEFFRDPLYFYYFESICNNMIKSGTNYIKVLSVGCSSGEEVYTIAMILNELKEKNKEFNFHITAIDIDKNAIDDAKKAIYNDYSISNLPFYYLNKYFTVNNNFFHFNSQLLPEGCLSFKHLNILNNEQILNGMLKFDFIFCRNVLIYLNKDNQLVILKNLIDLLDSDGYLILGRNEHLHLDLEPLFKQICKHIRIYAFNK
ncbi:conserved hypothetical protein [Deferribacter desulfuricans SSM1]|uniref:protein-glutamate O-methyltransferase n=1 Tax=Deferribacter desulfuricans (strain DSM 14783 / JCM 11476 / NBRC 101012 / SSM1) TaxID=639282 RepID=D3PDK4_DEFDS|nr:protein-glutamate O-methyltransferase CheR [Deferribacter desulfuricans]BAI80677.1 conserved hypothetical protein [Deferribacter desulfuricans SSM1]